MGGQTPLRILLYFDLFQFAINKVNISLKMQNKHDSS